MSARFHNRKECSYGGVIRTLNPSRLLVILQGFIVYKYTPIYRLRAQILERRTPGLTRGLHPPLYNKFEGGTPG
jgi:hypothetical protein